jgi:hypothetical protein
MATWLAAVLLGACDGKDDSARAETDADTDTDTDSDTDADTDTDTDADTDTDTDTDADTDTDTDSDTDTGVVKESWDADTITVDATFGYDESTGELVAASYGKTTLDPLVYFTLYNYDDVSKSAAPTQYCFVLWDVAGVPTAAAEFKSFWMSVDLVGMPMTFDDGKGGNCEGLSTLWGDARGSTESLEDFIDSQDFAFGIHSIDDVDSTIISDWRSYWVSGGLDKLYGSWRSVEPTIAAGAFSASITKWAPGEADVMFAYEIDSSTWALSTDKSGSVVPLDVSGATAPPTAYYESLGMYAYGTGF